MRNSSLMKRHGKALSRKSLFSTQISEPVFSPSSSHPLPVPVEPEGGCRGKQRLTAPCTLPPQDPAGRLLCAPTSAPRAPCTGCSRDRAAPCPAVLLCGCGIPAAGRGAGPGLSPWLPAHPCASVPTARSNGSPELACPGGAGAAARGVRWGKPPQKPAPSGRLAPAAAPGAGEGLAQFTQQTRSRGWLQPVKKLWRDRKRTA